MTAKELRDDIMWHVTVPIVGDYQDPKLGTVHRTTFERVTVEQLDSLIAVAKAEEREKIRADSQLITDAAYSWNFGEPFYLVDVDALEADK